MRGYGDTGGRTSSRRITPMGDSNIFSLYFCISVCICICIWLNCICILFDQITILKHILGNTKMRITLPWGIRIYCLCIFVCIYVCILSNCKKYLQSYGLVVKGDPNIFVFLFAICVLAALAALCLFGNFFQMKNMIITQACIWNMYQLS